MWAEQTIRRALDEFQCDHCGDPVRLGGLGFYVAKSGGAYCSVRCVGHDHEYERPAGGVPVPALFEVDSPSLF